MEPLPDNAPEDARPIPAEVRLRTVTPAGHIALAFPFAFVPPVVLALALAGAIPAAACWAIAVVGAGAIWLKLRGRPSVGFTPDALVVESLFGRRSVPWSAVRSVAFADVTDSDTHEVVSRRIARPALRRRVGDVRISGQPAALDRRRPVPPHAHDHGPPPRPSMAGGMVLRRRNLRRARRLTAAAVLGG